MRSLVLVLSSMIAVLCTASAQQVPKFPTLPALPSVEVIESVLAGTASVRLSSGGSIGGFGGGDSEDIRRISAWFYGTRAVEVCYNKSKAFGVNETRIESSIQNALNQWVRYFAEKKINSSLKMPINLNFNFKGKCKGNEDLVIFLGTGPIFQNLQDLKASQTLARPIAYVNKTHLSRDYKWSKGYIRLVEDFSYQIDGRFYPDWSNSNYFEQIVSHELGHVLGFKHTPGTLMSEDIVKDLILAQKKKMSGIDGTEELYLCVKCEVRYRSLNTNRAFFNYSEILFSENSVSILNAENVTQTLQVQHPEKKNSASSLVSVFEGSENFVAIPAVYFVANLNDNFVLIREQRSTKVFKDGNVVATFERVW